MCLFPKLIKNPRYTENKKNKGCVPICTDFRKLYVPIGCGECYECRRQKSQQWRVRLLEEIKVQKYKYFVTLTFAPNELEKLCYNEKIGENNLNQIATIAVRRFLERYRKKYKVSCKHWLITELGHENTERIHLHGILFPEHEMNNEELLKLWKYGTTDIGEYCNERTINYIVKYVTKIDTEHKNYKAIILASAGLGAEFTKDQYNKQKYTYKKGNSPEYYLLNNGRKVALPIYYRNKFYTEKERDNIWTDRLDKHEIFVNGIRIRNTQTEESQQYYNRLLANLQDWNNSIGYGNRSKEWQKEEYNVTWKMLQKVRKKNVSTEN